MDATEDVASTADGGNDAFRCGSGGYDVATAAAVVAETGRGDVSGRLLSLPSTALGGASVTRGGLVRARVRVAPVACTRCCANKFVDAAGRRVVYCTECHCSCTGGR